MRVDSLIGYSQLEWVEIFESMGEKSFRVKQIREWLYQKGVLEAKGMLNISKDLREKISGAGLVSGKVVFDVKSKDGTHKILIELEDGLQIESVMIPTSKRITFCISSQVGCAMGCKFCATAKLGIKRNLTSGEIISQVAWLRKISGVGPTHIVYMGMGEPFLNYENVIRSARILNDPECFKIGARRITISTVGVPHVIRQYADEKEQFHLAISLHAPNNELRKEIVPVNQKWELDLIFDAARYFNEVTGRIVTFEYVLLSGVNDLKEHAIQLRERIDFPAKINLIPFNDHNNSSFDAPEVSRVMYFQSELERLGLVATVRTSRGQDIAAACGQLANEKKGM